VSAISELDERVPDAHRMGMPPFSMITSGTAREQISVVDDLGAGMLGQLAFATIAVVVDPETGWARSSTRKSGRRHRESQADVGAGGGDPGLEVFQVLGWMGIGRMVGKVPFELGIEELELERSPVNNLGATRPPHARWPLSATT